MAAEVSSAALAVLIAFVCTTAVDYLLFLGVLKASRPHSAVAGWLSGFYLYLPFVGMLCPGLWHLATKRVASGLVLLVAGPPLAFGILWIVLLAAWKS
jgi:hypothetical protein